MLTSKILLLGWLLCVCALVACNADDAVHVQSDEGDALLGAATRTARTAVSERKTATLVYATLQRQQSLDNENLKDAALARSQTETPLAATADAYFADRTATADIRTSTQVASLNNDATRGSETETAAAILTANAAETKTQEAKGTATANANASATAVALQTGAPLTALYNDLAAQQTKNQIQLENQRALNQIAEENQQSYWRNALAPGIQIAWMLLPILLFLLGVRLLALYEQRHRVVQRGNTIVLITPGGLNFKQRKFMPTQYKVIPPSVSKPPEPNQPIQNEEIVEGQARELQDLPPTAPARILEQPNLQSQPAQELKTSSTNDANERFNLALRILDATLVQLSKALADGERLTSKPFSYDACAAAGYVQTWEEWGHIMDLWQAANIAVRPRAKSGWEVKVNTLKGGESLLTELYVRTGYVRTNGIWMKR